MTFFKQVYENIYKAPAIPSLSPFWVNQYIEELKEVHPDIVIIVANELKEQIKILKEIYKLINNKVRVYFYPISEYQKRLKTKQIIKFINAINKIHNLKEQTILVHCMHGRSRTAIMVLALLAKLYKISLHDGLEMCAKVGCLPKQTYMRDIKTITNKLSKDLCRI